MKTKTSLTEREYRSLVVLSFKLRKMHYKIKDHPLKVKDNGTFQDQISIAITAIDTILQEY